MIPNNNITKGSKVQRAQRRLEIAISDLEGIIVNSEVKASNAVSQSPQSEIKVKDLIDKNNAMKELNDILYDRLEIVIKRLKSALGNNRNG